MTFFAGSFPFLTAAVVDGTCGQDASQRYAGGKRHERRTRGQATHAMIAATGGKERKPGVLSLDHIRSTTLNGVSLYLDVLFGRGMFGATEYDLPLRCLFVGLSMGTSPRLACFVYTASVALPVDEDENDTKGKRTRMSKIAFFFIKRI